MSSLPDAVQPEAQFLKMQHVNVARGDAVVLHDINLQIENGEHVAILGPNGCGKSTLIKTITCECYPIVAPETSIRLLDRDRWDVSQLRRHLGVVEAHLPGERTGVTRGVDAVVAGFFSASTLWPNLHVTTEMRTLATPHSSACRPLTSKKNLSARCLQANSGAS